MTETVFVLHHLAAFMIALASLENPQGQHSYVIEETHDGAKPRVMRAVRTSAGYEITTQDNYVETREQVDGRGIVAFEKVEYTLIATTTIAPAADKATFLVRDDGHGESLVDLADVFSNFGESQLAQEGEHVLKCGAVEVDVERKANEVLVRQRGKRISFTIRPIEDPDTVRKSVRQSRRSASGEASGSE